MLRGGVDVELKGERWREQGKALKERMKEMSYSSVVRLEKLH